MHILPFGDRHVFTRDSAGLNALGALLQPLAPTLVVMEATGGLETVVCAHLAALREVPRKGVGQPLEAFLAIAVDLHCLGTGSLRTFNRKRAAWLSAVWSIP